MIYKIKKIVYYYKLSFIVFPILLFYGCGSGEEQVSLQGTSWETLFPNRYGIGSGGCAGTGLDFFTEQAFEEATEAYPTFANEGSDEIQKRELAAFFANISHETTGGGGAWCGGVEDYTSDCFNWGLCYREELGCESQTTCTDYGVSPSGTTYHGRGPIQITYDYNYTPVGEELGLPLHEEPQLLISDPVIAFKTAIWFWMTPQGAKPSCHDVIVNGTDGGASRPSGFGLTINIINGGVECNKGYITDKEKDRIGFYRRYAELLGATVGENLDCSSQPSF